ncbi:29284_t:CDS:2 [Gigaspora margarita]|uniref:DNA topoisomerase n=1 Tax=Gigaspora margarita TaxID=4874 RepID=A0ABM8W136_GIGMA|nr:29284_t:CDS:2 [Gigaspora margarita]
MVDTQEFVNRLKNKEKKTSFNITHEELEGNQNNDLESINAAKNKLKNLDWLADLPQKDKLKSLNLFGNEIEEVDFSLLTAFSNLESINLRNLALNLLQQLVESKKRIAELEEQIKQLQQNQEQRAEIVMEKQLRKTGIYNLGVDLENFLPSYDIISEKKATDPDREGEAIAQETAKSLGVDPLKCQRLLFYEITPRSIKEALNNPSTINQNLVESQLSRQVLDRMIGFCLSTILQKKLQALSAGRVQSVVLKLIAEREELIKKFDKKKLYIICGICQVNEQKITLKQVNEAGELIIYKDKAEAEEIRKKLGSNYSNTNPAWKKKEKTLNVQGAHESIHPTYLDYHPEDIKSSLSEEEYSLYKLIYNHTLASLMSPAQVNKITYNFLNNNYYFATAERICQFAGFLACFPEVYFPNYNVKLKSELEKISQLEAKKIEVQEYQENKPVRYNEGSLVQELERLGVGRPSTYNLFGRVLLKRGYAELNEKGQFVPTPLGVSVNN